MTVKYFFLISRFDHINCSFLGNISFSVAYPDPGLGAFLGIRDEQPGSYCLELRDHFFCFFGFKYLNSLRIREGKVESGMNIPDQPHINFMVLSNRLAVGG